MGKVLGERIDMTNKDGYVVDLTWIPNKTVNPSGTINTDTSGNYRMSNNIDIRGCKKVVISTNLHRSAYGRNNDTVVAVYDANGAFLRPVISPDAITSSNGTLPVSEFVYYPQDGDAYIVVSDKTTSDAIVIPEVIKFASKERTKIDLIDVVQAHNWAYNRPASGPAMYASVFINGFKNVKVSVKLKNEIANKVAIALFSKKISNWQTPDLLDTGWQTTISDMAVDESVNTLQVRIKGEFTTESTAEDVSAVVDYILVEYESELGDTDILPTLGYMNNKIASKTSGEYMLSILAKYHLIEAVGINIVSVNSISHRGYNTTAPENTMPAFKLSVQNGYKMIETDVRFTIDGIAVLLHDATINRTARNADGSTISTNININSITYEQALEYDFGIYKSANYEGTKIPTLNEFLSLCRACSIHPYLELKAGSPEEIADVVSAVNDYGLTNSATFISTDVNYLSVVKDNVPTARLGLICQRVNQNNINQANTLYNGINDVFIDAGSYYGEAVTLCKSAGIKLEVWTVDNPTTIKNADPYITGFTSNNQNAANILRENALL